MLKQKAPLLSGYLERKRISAALPFLRGRVLDIGCNRGPLAERIPSENYHGCDINPAAVEEAAGRFPHHRFSTALPQGPFDTVAALAVIEHVPHPIDESVAAWIKPLTCGGSLVLTTPHKAFRLVHEAGAAVGLVSSHAAEDHETLFNRWTLYAALASLPLKPERYRRFLYGMNQLFVFRKL